MFYRLNKKTMYPGYVSKHNSNREKQVILLMISNREKREVKSKDDYDIIFQLKSYQHY